MSRVADDDHSLGVPPGKVRKRVGRRRFELVARGLDQAGGWPCIVRECLEQLSTSLRDLGEYRLRDLNRPERVFQLVAPDLRDDTAVDRVLATILFTDIVNSTATAVELGDQRWRALLAAHHTLVRDHLPQFHGRLIRSTGDGVFAAFDTPTRAIQCAWAVGERVRSLGIEITAGVHTGECESVGDVLEGVAVHLAARVAGVAEGGEVLVSSTVKDLVTGSATAFVDRGTRIFKGLPGEWHVFAVERTAGSSYQPRVPQPSLHGLANQIELP